MDKVQDIYKNQVLPHLDQVDKLLLDKIPHIKLLTDKGVKPSVAIGSAALVLTIVFVFLIGEAGLCNLVGFVFPVIGSYKALKSEDTKDDSQWLTYWVVYGFLNMFESVTDLLCNWVPMYYWLKCAFLVWCFLPQTKGASIVYKLGLEPILDKYVIKAEKAVAKQTDAVKKVIRSVTTEGGDNEDKNM